MTNNTKTVSRILGAILICFIMWRVSLCLGSIRASPKEWVDYRNGYTRNSDPGIMPDGDVRCPSCLGHVAALYGGIANPEIPSGDGRAASWTLSGSATDAERSSTRTGRRSCVSPAC